MRTGPLVVNVFKFISSFIHSLSHGKEGTRTHDVVTIVSTAVVGKQRDQIWQNFAILANS